MEDKIKLLKEMLIDLHYGDYKHDYLDDKKTWFDVGFIHCASVFLSDEEMEECKEIAWKKYIDEEGYTEEEAEELEREAIRMLLKSVEKSDA